MLKFLLLLVLIVWLWYSPAVRKLLRGGTTARPTPASPPPSTPDHHATDAIVPCAHCGVHLPSQEALMDEHGQIYCSEAHRRAGPRPT